MTTSGVRSQSFLRRGLVDVRVWFARAVCGPAIGFEPALVGFGPALIGFALAGLGDGFALVGPVFGFEVVAEVGSVVAGLVPEVVVCCTVKSRQLSYPRNWARVFNVWVLGRLSYLTFPQTRFSVTWLRVTPV